MDEATSDCNCMQVIPFCFLPSSTQYTAVKQNVCLNKFVSFLTCLSSVFPCTACSLSNHQLPQMFVSQFCWLRQQTAHSIISWWRRKKSVLYPKNTRKLFLLFGFSHNWIFSKSSANASIISWSKEEETFSSKTATIVIWQIISSYYIYLCFTFKRLYSPAQYFFTASSTSLKTSTRNLQNYFSFLCCRDKPVCWVTALKTYKIYQHHLLEY